MSNTGEESAIPAPAEPGEVPDLRAAAPLDLPALLLRASVGVSVVAWLLVLAAGLWQAGADVDEELRAAVSLAAAMARVSQAAAQDDAAVLQALQRQAGEVPLRHLRPSLHDAAGRLLYVPPPLPPPSAPVAWLMALQARWRAQPSPAQSVTPVQWPLPRPDGRVWTLTLSPTAEAEQREAVESLLGGLLLLAAGAVAWVAVQALQLRRSLRPMRVLLAAIADIRAGRPEAAQQLPPMPVRELQAVGDALAALGRALQQAEGQRRALQRRMLTLQDDERRRLARELHDELGQRLTALRLDTAYLARRVEGHADAELPAVAQGMGAQCERLQRDVRDVLARLAPPVAAGGAELRPLLASLVQSWQRDGRGPAHTAAQIRLRCEIDDARPWPDALVGAVYRISQEALTNVARHAAASAATLSLQQRPDGRLDWSVCDDGAGLADPAAALARGSGLAGIRERVWSLGGDLQIEPMHPGRARPGLCLRALLDPAAAGEAAR